MAKHIREILITVSAIILACSCTSEQYYRVEDSHFLLGDEPQYFIGTNMWYASAIAVQDPDRLNAELDALHELGLDNVRILATDENWEGLDIVMDELEKRGMCGVFFLNNAWEWSEDGYISYLEKAGAGHQPRPAVEGYMAYMTSMWRFASNPKAVELFHGHVRNVVERYRDRKAVFSWQICNEPRPFSADWKAVEDYVAYIHSTARLIKEIDPNHMVSTGNEGAMGCNDGDYNLCQRINQTPDIDYITIHIWPYNWDWAKEENIGGGLEAAIAESEEYIQKHIEMGLRLEKPVVIEEFGYPRDGFEYVNTSTTESRDDYYRYIFSKVKESSECGGLLAGCNFWSWSGYAKQTPGHQFWQEGDDLAGDPSQEAQGLNGVYISDASTIEVIKQFAPAVRDGMGVYAPTIDNCVFTKGPARLKVKIRNPKPDSIITMIAIRDTTLNTPHKDTAFVEYKRFSKNDGHFGLGVLEPGFYQINIGQAQFNIAIRPEEISSPQDKQPDFEQFWAETLAELAATPLNTKMTLIPEHSNDVRKCYHVEVDSFGGGKMGGILMLPVKPGKYPVSLEYMGYAADPYYRDPNEAPDVINFLVSVRGQGLYKKPGYDGWAYEGLESEQNYYYRGAFCDVVRAIDFICSLEQADTERIFAWGDSQGGAFTWVSASLDHRVKAIAPSVPFLGDYADYAKIVYWPVCVMYETGEKQGLTREQILKTLSYFDMKNLTDKVECPVYMAFGLQDPVCPGHTNFAAYNQCKSEKKYWAVAHCKHAMWAEPTWHVERLEYFKQYL